MGIYQLPDMTDQTDLSANETHQRCQTQSYFQVVDLTQKIKRSKKKRCKTTSF